jgi:release factor glutamine methyltransferase
MGSTLINLIDKGAKLLKNNGIRKARSESILITQKALKKSALYVITNPKIRVPKDKKEKILRKFVQRSEGKPISKIFGMKEFFSNEFFVNSNVLDPRPDSELLVNVVLRKYMKEPISQCKILDLGVGSGCLIISILLELQHFDVKGLGIDISGKAIEIAKKNVKKFNLQNILKIKNSDWFSNINDSFDIIISNPPYIKTLEIENLSGEVKFYDPFISLDGGCDGLSAYKKIAVEAKKFLKKDGIIFLEIGFGQLNSVKKIFRNFGYKTILEEKDLQDINRVVGYTL